MLKNTFTNDANNFEEPPLDFVNICKNGDIYDIKELIIFFF
jgi:hypothetical protein